MFLSSRAWYFQAWTLDRTQKNQLFKHYEYIDVCCEKEITNEKIFYHHCFDGVIVIIIRAVKNAL